MQIQDFELYMLKFCIKYNIIDDREDFLQNLRIVTLKCIEKYRDNDKGIFPYLEKAYKNELDRFIKSNRLIKIPIWRTDGYEVKTFSYENDDEENLKHSFTTNKRFNYNLLTMDMKLNYEEKRLASWYLKGYTLREIGNMYNVSHELVRQKMNKITKKLKGLWLS